MINAPVLLSKDLTATYTPICAARCVATIIIETPSTNTDSLFIQATDGSDSDDIEIPVSQWYEFESVDLAQIYVKGTSGDIVRVIGNRVQQ